MNHRSSAILQPSARGSSFQQEVCATCQQRCRQRLGGLLDRPGDTFPIGPLQGSTSLNSSVSMS